MTLRAMLAIAGFGVLAAPGTALGAKHLIAGKVIDRNGQPVVQAIITLAPGNVQVVTDRDGNFLVEYLRDDEGERVKLAKKTDYTVEIFKPGYHTQTTQTYFQKGELTLEPITLVEETIQVTDDTLDLDPDIYVNATHSAGANYEGQ